MNPFIIKTLGNLLALAEVGSETYEKSKVSLEERLGEKELEDLIEKNNIHAEEIRRIAEKTGKEGEVEALRGKASGKLRQMRDIYMGEKYSSSEDVLEWLSIFSGISYGEWSLLKGLGEKDNDMDILTISEEAINFHHNTLDIIASELESLGNEGDQPQT